MGMSVQKKFICGLASFVLFTGVVGFIIGFFARESEKKTCDQGHSAKRENTDTTERSILEKEVFELVSAQRIRDYQRNCPDEFDIAGTNDSCTHAHKIVKEWKSMGLDTVTLNRYEVLLSYPTRPSKLSLVDQTGNVVYSLNLKATNSWHVLDNVTPAMFPLLTFYSKSGISSGKLLYVNYGREGDFKYLKESNISCKGKILILRYGKIHEGTKVSNAQKWNAAGVLLYLDPIDMVNSTKQESLAKDYWYDPSVISEWANRGDPFTPGYPAKARVSRESLDDISLTDIPVQPISNDEAEKLLRILNNTMAPNHWQGGLSLRYYVQMDQNDTRNASLNVSLARAKTPVCNAVATIKGDQESDRYILLGSARPFATTAILMEVARILSSIRKKGWLPQRTIKICSWGAGNIGSVEWIEEYLRVLDSRVISYLTVDSAVQEVPIGVKLHPLLEYVALKAIKKVNFLDSSSLTLCDKWTNTSSVSENIGRSCSPFVNRVGVPCVSLIYTPYNLSSALKSPADILRAHAAFVKVLLHMTFDMTGSLFIPFWVDQYATVLREWVEDLSDIHNYTLKSHNITLEFLIKAAEEFQVAAKTFQDRLQVVNNENVLQVRMFNDRLIQLERAFIDKESFSAGASGRHVVFSSTQSQFSATSENKFSGITDAIHRAQYKGDESAWHQVRRQISIAIHAFRSAVLILKPTDS